MTRLRTLVVLGVILLVAAGCGSGAATAETASGEVNEQPVAGVVETLSGAKFDLGSIEGQDTLLWFWAPW